jgi:hypothetical protein
MGVTDGSVHRRRSHPRRKRVPERTMSERQRTRWERSGRRMRKVSFRGGDGVISGEQKRIATAIISTWFTNATITRG